MPGRATVAREVQELIRKMSLANRLWGAIRIHEELLKLGIEISQATVAKHMVRHQKPPSQTWPTFLNNHLKDPVSVDFFVVPTVTFRVLFVCVVLAHHRRRQVHFNRSRTHRALDKDAPESRPIQPPEFGEVVELPQVGGLHHRYRRRAA